MAVSLNVPVESSCQPSTIYPIYLITVFLHLLKDSLTFSSIILLGMTAGAMKSGTAFAASIVIILSFL